MVADTSLGTELLTCVEVADLTAPKRPSESVTANKSHGGIAVDSDAGEFKSNRDGDFSRNMHAADISHSANDAVNRGEFAPQPLKTLTPNEVAAISVSHQIAPEMIFP